MNNCLPGRSNLIESLIGIQSPRFALAIRRRNTYKIQMFRSIRFDQTVSIEMRAGVLLIGEEADWYDTVEWVASQS
jgi:hypothetical protein